MTAPVLALPWWIPTKEALEERERILAGRYFLVRITGNDIFGPCQRCNGRHRYLTLMCVEQPFSGVTGGLWAYYKVIEDEGALAFLSPAEQARFKALEKRIIGDLAPKRGLGSSHPQLARSLHVPDRDADLGAISMGILEPITKVKAAMNARAINFKGIKPPFILDGVGQG